MRRQHILCIVQNALPHNGRQVIPPILEIAIGAGDVFVLIAVDVYLGLADCGIGIAWPPPTSGNP
ncbi:MAG: hypothetical protein WBF93_14590, partial [Pirellulales bacterium]